MSKKGTSTFVMQRASAVLLVPFVIWFLISLVAHAGNDFDEIRTWLARPLTSIPFALLVVVGAFHMRIGMSEVINDYIHSGLRGLLLALNWAVAIGVAVAAIWSAHTLIFAG